MSKRRQDKKKPGMERGKEKAKKLKNSPKGKGGPIDTSLKELGRLNTLKDQAIPAKAERMDRGICLRG